MAGTFIQVVVISRALRLEDAGTVFLLFTLMNLAATMGRFGTDNLVLRRIAGGHPGHAREARWLQATCLMASSLSGALMSGLLWSGALQFPAAAIGPIEAMIVGLMTVFYALGVFSGAVLRGSGRLVAGIMAELGVAPWLTVVFVVILSVTGKATLVTVLFSLLTAGALAATWSLWAAWAKIPRQGPLEWDEGVVFVREHLSSLMRLMGTSVLFLALVWIPQLGLGLIGTASQVAQYTAASRIASFIAIFPGIQTSYLGPKFAALAYAGKLAELSRSCGGAAVTSMLVAVPLLVTVSAAPNSILNLFGSGYAESAAPVLILSIGAYLTLALGQVNTVMVTANLERAALRLNLMLLVFVASVVIAAGPYIGVVGISIASAVGSFAYAVAAALTIRFVMGVDTTLANYFQRAFSMKPIILTGRPK